MKDCTLQNARSTFLVYCTKLHHMVGEAVQHDRPFSSETFLVGVSHVRVALSLIFQAPKSDAYVVTT